MSVFCLALVGVGVYGEMMPRGIVRMVEQANLDMHDKDATCIPAGDRMPKKKTQPAMSKLCSVCVAMSQGLQRAPSLWDHHVFRHLVLGYEGNDTSRGSTLGVAQPKKLVRVREFFRFYPTLPAFSSIGF